MIIYHLPFTHQFFVGKLHSPSTSFPVLKIGQKLGPGRRRPACQIPRCQVEMLTGALGLEALKNRELWVRRTREHRAGIFNGCRFFLDVKGRDVRIQMKTKRYTWSWSGRKILCFLHAVMFSFCFNIAASMATCTELQESFEQRCATWIRSEVVHLWKALPWKEIFQHVARPYRFKRWLLVCFSTTSAYR